jgi:ElaB/YqjD/DUF883 family membrane-anchored ribosome-binding protein
MEWNFSRDRTFPAGTGRLPMATANPSSSYKPSPTNGTSPADVEKQLETIRNDISTLTRQMTDLVNQTKDSTMAQVKSQVRSAKAQVDSAITGAQESGREAVDAFRDVADTFGDAIEDSLKRRPYATLAMAAGLGFLFGAAWRS